MKRTAAAVLLLGLLSAGLTQPHGHIHVTANRAVNGQLHPVTHGEIGETLRYRAIINMQRSAERLEVVLPLSPTFAYAGGISVPQGSEVLFSADGRQYPPVSMPLNQVRFVKIRLPALVAGDVEIAFDVKVR